MGDSFDGLELLRIIKRSRPEIDILIISGQAGIHGAVEAMKLGARDYLEKPIDLNKLKEILDSIRNESDAYADNGLDEHGLTFASDQMRKTMAIMKRLAVRSDLTILIQGESGTYFLLERQSP